MEFNTFSKKQIKVLCWWHENSPYKNYDAIICDGSIRSGKTLCMGISFIAWAFYNFNGERFAICGKTIRSIKRNFIDAVLPAMKNLGFKCNLKVSENLIEIKSLNKSNKFYLFGGKDESSASLIQGITLSGIFFDEVALMPHSFVEQALARCSVKNSKFWFNCNPEYPQHWFYQDWILKHKKKNSLYLHFTLEDNPSLTRHIKNRYEKLYSGTFYERFILGKWVATTGMVYPEMTNNDAFVPIPKHKFESYYVSCDYGTVNPASFGLWGKYEDSFYRINEYYYDSRKIGKQKTDEEHYEALCDLVKDLKIKYITIDPSAASFITLVRQKSNFKVIPAKNNVLDGIRKVSSVLKNKTIFICNTCKDTIREFSLYRWEDSNVKDSPLKENDHAMDDIRYFVTTILPIELDENSEADFMAFALQR